MQIIKFRITGTKPLLMHSDKFADPLNPATKAHKELTSKRKKSDEDHEAIAKSEWLGGLYYDEDLGPYLPGVMLDAVIVSGAKLSKLGTHVKRSVEVMDFKVPLVYDGPRTPQELWDARFYDARSVKVQAARLMRYRPLFMSWSAEFDVVFDEESINQEQVVKCLVDGGLYAGIGDYRPKFGRFSVEVL